MLSDKPCSESNRFDAIIAEFIEAFRCNEKPSIDEYAEKHTEFADQIRELLPTIIAVEQFREIQSDETSSPPMPESLGDLKIVREIGRGGMGIVFEAIQQSLDRRVAVKILPSQMLLDEKRLKRFTREAQTAARLHHTNIVPILGVGKIDGFCFHLMQLIDGVAVDKLIRQEASTSENNTSISREVIERFPSSPAGIARLSAQVADALRYAHQQGVLHRDIKPANLILDTEGVLWIADFGLSKSVESDAVTQTGDVLGTIRYMAPEQFLGESDPRSDIYSLGLTIYEMLTGRSAFGTTRGSYPFANSPSALPLCRPSKWNPSITKDLDAVILKATALDANDRYQTAGELAEDLQCVAEDRPIALRRASIVHRIWRWSRRNRGYSSSICISVSATILVAILSTLSYFSERELNEKIKRALANTQSAYNKENEQRLKAESTSAIAWNALDEVFLRFAPPGAVPSAVINDEDGISIRPAISTATAEVLQNLLPFYTQLTQGGDDSVEHRLRIAEAHRRIGDIYQRLESYDLAEKSFGKSLELFHGVSSDNKSGVLPDVPIARAFVYNELANIHRAQLKHRSEIVFRQKALDSFVNILSGFEPDKTELLFELSRTLYLHGHHDREVVGKPKSDRKRELLFWPADAKLPPNVQEQFFAKGISSELATEAAIQILEPLSENPECRFLLALCYQNVTRDTQRVAAGRPDTKAIKILTELVDEYPDLTEYRYALCVAWIADVPKGLRNRDTIKTVANRAQQAEESALILVQTHPHEPAYQLLRARIVLRQASNAILAKNLHESERLYENSRQMHETLLQRFPNSMPCQLARISCLAQYARHETRVADPAQSRELWGECIHAIEQLESNGGAPGFLRKLKADALHQVSQANTDEERVPNLNAKPRKIGAGRKESREGLKTP
ncbi:MAG: serine/threonine-protein kinase [Planctomycetota bacterium]